MSKRHPLSRTFKVSWRDYWRDAIRPDDTIDLDVVLGRLPVYLAETHALLGMATVDLKWGRDPLQDLAQVAQRVHALARVLGNGELRYAELSDHWRWPDLGSRIAEVHCGLSTALAWAYSPKEKADFEEDPEADGDTLERRVVKAHVQLCQVFCAMESLIEEHSKGGGLEDYLDEFGESWPL